MLVRVVVIVLIVFALYAVFNDPSQSGNAVSGAWGHVEDGAQSVGTFFQSLIDH